MYYSEEEVKALMQICLLSLETWFSRLDESRETGLGYSRTPGRP